MKKESLKKLWEEGSVPGQGDMEIPKYAKDIKAIACANLPDKIYKVNQRAEKYGHKVIFNPPYHPQINAIEMAWGVTKNYVALHNEGESFGSLHDLIITAIDTVTPEVWSKIV